MRSRIRSLDSKITFFAFADIITAVSGMLIFITLLLATDLERPAESSPQGADPESERRLQQTLQQQLEVDAENRHLQELLAAAETAPAAEKLESDISRLRSQVSEERQKQTALAAQSSGSHAEILARDTTLGLTDLKVAIERASQEAAAIAGQAAKAQSEMANLEQQVSRMQSQLLAARQREGQLWIIPGKGTDKEPIFVTVTGSGVTIDRFDHPEQRRQLDKTDADSSFKSYLRGSKPLDQYVVFEIKPSGIALFEELANIARTEGFEVGFDARGEKEQIHLSTPPPLDEPEAPTNAVSAGSEQTSSSSSTNFGPPPSTPPVVTVAKTNQPQPAAATTPATPRQPKGWWQRFLEWIGLA